MARDQPVYSINYKVCVCAVLVTLHNLMPTINLM